MIVEEDQSIVDIIDENIESEDVSEEIVSSVGVTQGEEERRSPPPNSHLLLTMEHVSYSLSSIFGVGCIPISVVFTPHTT